MGEMGEMGRMSGGLELNERSRDKVLDKSEKVCPIFPHLPPFFYFRRSSRDFCNPSRNTVNNSAQPPPPCCRVLQVRPPSPPAARCCSSPPSPPPAAGCCKVLQLSPPPPRAARCRSSAPPAAECCSSAPPLLLQLSSGQCFNASASRPHPLWQPALQATSGPGPMFHYLCCSRD